jgi:hypothetical protein
MKTWPLLIGVIVILTIICSPVPAISKSDLISQYKTGQLSGSTMPTPTSIWPYPSLVIPTTAPTPAPTKAPTAVPSAVPIQAYLGTEALSVWSNPPGAMVYLDGVPRGWTPCTMLYVSAGSHQLKLTKPGYTDYSSLVTVEVGKTYLLRGDGILPDIPGCGASPCRDVNYLTVMIDYAEMGGIGTFFAPGTITPAVEPEFL